MKKKGIDTAPRVTGQRYSRVAAVVQEQLQKYHAAYEKEDVQGALSSALDLIKFLNDFQDKEKPWTLSGDDLAEFCTVNWRLIVLLPPCSVQLCLPLPSEWQLPCKRNFL